MDNYKKKKRKKEEEKKRQNIKYKIYNVNIKYRNNEGLLVSCP